MSTYIFTARIKATVVVVVVVAAAAATEAAEVIVIDKLVGNLALATIHQYSSSSRFLVFNNLRIIENTPLMNLKNIIQV